MTNIFIIIDGNSLLNRAFYAIPPLTTPDGTPSNAVYGFINMLLKAVSDYKPTHIAVAFDLPGGNFRHKQYAEYKATRKGMSNDLAVQLPLLKQLLKDMGILTVEAQGYEADDIIGTLVNKITCDCGTNSQAIVITGDRDALQLINECTRVAYTKRGISNITMYDRQEFTAEYGFEPMGLIEYKALCGDSSDNIPGAQGVGEVSAKKLVSQYKNIESIYCNLNELPTRLKENLVRSKELVFLSKQLATIMQQVPLTVTPSDCTFKLPLTDIAKDGFIRMGFNTLLKRKDLFESDYVGADTQQSVLVKDDHEGFNDILKGIPTQLSQAKNSYALNVKRLDSLNELQLNDTFAINIEQNEVQIYCRGTMYVMSIQQGFLDDGISMDELCNSLRKQLADEKILKIVNDAKQLKKQLKMYGCTLNGFFDVRLSTYLIDSNAKTDTVKQLCEYYNLDVDFGAYALAIICDVHKNALKQMRLMDLYYNIELPLVDVLFDMENTGFKLDATLIVKLNQEFNAQLLSLTQQIHADCGKEFNINSPKQLGQVLFGDLGLPYPRKNPSSYSTAAEILEPLSIIYPVVKKVLNYRTIAKLNGTYVEGLKKMMDTQGIVHTEFKQALTQTGRLSSVEPNLQSIPVREDEGRKLRALFVPKDGFTLISADYSQIELRLLAHFSKDKTLCDAFNNNEDIHAQTAAIVFGVPLTHVTHQMRSSAKAVSFGIVYGISDYGLATSLQIPVAKAKELINNYFNRFSDIKRYLDNSITRARMCGYSTTLMGRIRFINEMDSPNANVRKFGERIAMNTPLQGSAADIIKVAMIKADKQLKMVGARLLLQVHDELIAECPLDVVDEAKQILVREMENAVSLKVPLVADAGSGDNWLNCKS